MIGWCIGWLVSRFFSAREITAEVDIVRFLRFATCYHGFATHDDGLDFTSTRSRFIIAFWSSGYFHLSLRYGPFRHFHSHVNNGGRIYIVESCTTLS